MSLPAVNSLLEDVRRGVPGSSDQVWSLINLELWHRTFIDRDGIQTLPEPRRTAREPVAASQPAVSPSHGPRG